jgi:DNA topoisomerase III
MAKNIVFVAEKNSIAKAIANFLGDNVQTHSTANKYVKNYKFFLRQTSLFNKYYSQGPRSTLDVNCTVTSVMGHLTSTDFDKSNSIARWCNDDMQLQGLLKTVPIKTYVQGENNPQIASNIQRLCENADHLIICTDCDNEGEYIGWEVLMAANYGVHFEKERDCSVLKEALSNKVKFNGGNVWRMEFSNVEKTHLKKAVMNPKKLDPKKVEAVRTRIEFDLRTGSIFTRYLTNHYRKTPYAKNQDKFLVSYGSCQFPALGFVVDRHDRVESFTPEEFHYIYIRTELSKSKVSWARPNLFDRFATALIYENLINTESDIVKVQSVVNRNRVDYSPQPLTTVELQKECSRLFHFSAKETLKNAETLYQSGFISYPRTDTNCYPPDFDFDNVINQLNNIPEYKPHCQRLANEGPLFKKPRNGSKNDFAHLPIYPLLSVSPEVKNSWNPQTKTIYNFVCVKFLASCSKDAIYSTCTLTLNWGKTATQSGVDFVQKAEVLVEANYKDVISLMFSKSRSGNKETSQGLPAKISKLKAGDEIPLLETGVGNGKTSAPSLLKEAGLITLMDINGIGTDATIGEHIETLKTRNYIEVIGKSKFLKPTPLGINLIHGFQKMGLGPIITKPFFRSEMEQSINKIISGEMLGKDVLQQCMHSYSKVLKTTINKGHILMREARAI